MSRPFVSVVLPCLNEQDAVGLSVVEAFEGLQRAGLAGEVIVVDNGSTDRSAEVAMAAGATVVTEATRGMGAAVARGVRAARGVIVVMADADFTYDLANLGELVAAVEAGADMAIGDRFALGLDGAGMPRLHRHIGTPALTAVVRFLTGVRVRDTQSGYRAFSRERFLNLGMTTPGWEFNFEMFVRAQRAGWTIVELPSRYRTRVGQSKLRTFSAGWRQLRLLLVMSPHRVLLYPGLVLIAAGLALCLVALIAPEGIRVSGNRWLPIFIGPMCLIVGTRMAWLGILAVNRSPFVPVAFRHRTRFLQRRDSIERVLVAFLGMTVAGLAIDGILLGLYVSDSSWAGAIGLAGFAQALIVIGADGMTSTLSADFAEQALNLHSTQLNLATNEVPAIPVAATSARVPAAAPGSDLVLPPSG